MLDAAVMPGSRNLPASNVFLTLDGVKCGPVRSADGGFVNAEVITGPAGKGVFQGKHVSGVRYEPFAVTVGFANAAPVYDWVADLWKGNFVRKSGSLVVADYKLEAKSAREFLDAQLTETTLPTLDASSKDPGFLTLKFSADLVKDSNASGKQDAAAAKAKLWQRSDFRLQIDSLDCTKVSKIESMSVKQKTAKDDAGQSTTLPTVLEFPDLEVTLSEVSAKTWFEWLDDFVIKGKNDESSERSGTIQLLAADAKTELARIKLIGLGIYRMSLPKAGDKARNVTAGLYCSRMELVVKP